MLNRWAEHFQTLLSPINNRTAVEPNDPDNIERQTHREDEKSDLDDVKHAIQKLKNNKAEGIDGIATELQKNRG